jgi:hypothetical protein
MSATLSIDVKNSSSSSFIDIDKLKQCTDVVVKGRLRENLSFWEKIGASRWVLDIIRVGYYLPFVELPKPMVLSNHKSAFKSGQFVTQEIEKLVRSGVLVEVQGSELTVCNPLGVVFNHAEKPRLILDLRYVNQHLRTCKFQYEDIRTAANLFKKGDWFFKFDYSSGYHHIEIVVEHTKFLGCSWWVNGIQKFFKFTVLPFGLATGPYVFSKVQRALVKHWRERGFRIFTYLDDGAGAESSRLEAQNTSALVQQDIEHSGFVAHKVKCQWEPAQSGELLGFIMDLRDGTFRVPQRRVESLQRVLNNVVSKGFVASARTLSRITGMLVSMGLAVGPVVRLWTRGMYRNILETPTWDKQLALSEEAQREVSFWIENFSNNGYPIWSPSPKVDVMTFSDASASGWGGYAVQVGDHSATGTWSMAEEQKSSTWREIRAARLVLESLVFRLQGREVLHRTDNMNTVRILSVGSRKEELHCEAVEIYKLCQKHSIRLSVEWVPRDDNVCADALSRTEDANDYSLDPLVFQQLDKRWGPYTVDRFASMRTKQLTRFCSRFLNPGSEAVDAFTVSWKDENNWIFPPPYLIPRVLQHMAFGNEVGTLIVPEWHSAPWWPLLVTKDGCWQKFVVDSCGIQPYDGVLIPGSSASSQFASGTPPYVIVALRISFLPDMEQL